MQFLKKKWPFLPGIFKFLGFFLALLFLVFLARDQVKLHFGIAHLILHQCTMVCGSRSSNKEVKNWKKNKNQRFYSKPHLHWGNSNKSKRTEWMLTARTNLLMYTRKYCSRLFQGAYWPVALPHLCSQDISCLISSLSSWTTYIKPKCDSAPAVPWVLYRPGSCYS